LEALVYLLVDSHKHVITQRRIAEYRRHAQSNGDRRQDDPENGDLEGDRVVGA